MSQATKLLTPLKSENFTETKIYMLVNNKVLRGRYRIIQPLGQGAASSVYEAYDSERETNVALKEILIDLEKVANIAQREKIKHDFANQAKILAKVKHESLPQVRGYFAEVDRHYLIMELVDGTDVSEMLAKGEGSAALTEVTNWADQLLDTLDYLHTFTPSIVHHDINPANVKLTSRGKIKLLGFDITNGTDAESNVTVKNQAAIVLNYLPLEHIVRISDQASRKKLTDNYSDRLKKILTQPVDAQGDIYALGATIYYLLTAQIPVDALERTLEVWAENPDPLPTAQTVNPEIPIEVSDVLVKALEIERENRFESAMQMRQSLQAAVKKAKERTAEESKNREVAATREAFLAEEKRLEQERQLVEQERQRIEAERKHQAELIERQLKEAEAQRLQAEQRAVEAEKRLSEKENQKSSEEPPTAHVKSADSPESADLSLKSGNKSPVFEDVKILFAEPPKERKSSWIMPVAALTFLIVGGIIAGVVFMRSSNAAESKKPTVNPSAVLADKIASETPDPSPPEAEVERVSETTPSSSPTPNPVVATISQNAPKPKAVQPAPAPKVVKPVAAPPTKAPTGQKKAVTVDDLIGN